MQTVAYYNVVNRNAAITDFFSYMVLRENIKLPSIRIIFSFSSLAMHLYN